MRTPRSRIKGLSMIETVAMLTVISLLTSAIAPVISRTVARSRLDRARQDVRGIRGAILAFMADVPRPGFYLNKPKHPKQGNRMVYCSSKDKRVLVEMAVGDGDVPEVGPDGDRRWARAVDFEKVDFLENHLVRNCPGGRASAAYKNWFGAYVIGPIRPDPWGNRYMANVIYLAGDKPSPYDVVVISAGPDEEIDSKFELDGFVVGDDDVVCLVSPGSKGKR